MRVRILRGHYRGREGSISGTLADRRARGVTKAIVKIEGELPELLETSSLEAVTQFELELQTQKEPPPARRPAAVEYRDEAGRR